jgi:Fe-S-cluster-containing hydrogenase component 2
VAVCEFGALELNCDGLVIIEDSCTLCDNCVIFCPSRALENDDERRI